MGMSGHEFGRAAFDATISGALNIKDPGTGGTLTINDVSGGVCELTIAATAETRTLPTASAFKTGVEVTVVANQISNSGYVTINSVVLSAEGDYVVFKTMLVNDAMTWMATTRGINSFAVATPVTLSVSTTLVAGLHANRQLIMSGAGSSRLHQPPSPTGTGNIYRFVVGAVNTSNYVINCGGNLFKGVIAGAEAGAAYTWNAGATDNEILMNGTTTGGAAIGDWVELRDYAAGLYAVSGMVTQSGTQATPFATN